jgi:hypothetical protein
MQQPAKRIPWSQMRPGGAINAALSEAENERLKHSIARTTAEFIKENSPSVEGFLMLRSVENIRKWSEKPKSRPQAWVQEQSGLGVGPSMKVKKPRARTFLGGEVSLSANYIRKSVEKNAWTKDDDDQVMTHIRALQKEIREKHK